MRFSERMGFKQPRTAIQIDSMDDALRNGLWNVFAPAFIGTLNASWEVSEPAERRMQVLWDDFFKLPMDEAPRTASAAARHFKPLFLEGDWIDVFDLVDFTVEHYNAVLNYRLEPAYSRVLEREVSAYRFIDGVLSPISNEVELEGIAEGMRLTGGFSASAAHLKAALRMLSDRKEPDYRNSVKESISSVESAARVITGQDKPTLGQLLPILEKTGRIHPAQRDAFSKLYGYTSDEGGIRHAMLEETAISFADAKYMLVVCAAFVAYLQADVARGSDG